MLNYKRIASHHRDVTAVTLCVLLDRIKGIAEALFKNSIDAFSDLSHGFIKLCESGQHASVSRFLEKSSLYANCIVLETYSDEAGELQVYDEGLYQLCFLDLLKKISEHLPKNRVYEIANEPVFDRLKSVTIYIGDKNEKYYKITYCEGFEESVKYFKNYKALCFSGYMMSTYNDFNAEEPEMPRISVQMTYFPEDCVILMPRNHSDLHNVIVVSKEGTVSDGEAIFSSGDEGDFYYPEKWLVFHEDYFLALNFKKLDNNSFDDSASDSSVGSASSIGDDVDPNADPWKKLKDLEVTHGFQNGENSQVVTHTTCRLRFEGGSILSFGTGGSLTAQSSDSRGRFSAHAQFQSGIEAAAENGVLHLRWGKTNAEGGCLVTSPKELLPHRSPALFSRISPRLKGMPLVYVFDKIEPNIIVRPSENDVYSPIQTPHSITNFPEEVIRITVTVAPSKNSVYVMYGESGIGKSYLASHLLTSSMCVFETDAAKSRTDFIQTFSSETVTPNQQKMIVLGNKHKIRLDDLFKDLKNIGYDRDETGILHLF
ncbi:hypothetical protein DID77_01710 [Candidatus Marinamargulisbacteria bacterium SCGC AG-439-L15]|nr:hypothetical protein DID77_01710 [Candidatus Marinamargulisbacteria bacterium SCGC AG-439-L15]